MQPIRALVVDDSIVMRQLIIRALSADPSIEVVGQASDPHEARTAIKKLNPDVITLDVEMPSMNGLEFLEKIMRLRPMPVVMVSTLTQKGADVTINAFELGAIDCVAKPDSSNPAAFDGLAKIVSRAARARVNFRRQVSSGTRAPKAQGERLLSQGFQGETIAIGASTGGVEALITILKRFPENCPATVITQHMPPLFTKSLAARLDRLSAPEVVEATDKMPLQSGRVVLAPGGDYHLGLEGTRNPVCRLRKAPTVSGHRPSVDYLFHSVAETVGNKAVGVILTGMGRDGARGLYAMRQSGAHTIGQDAASSVVYGMPKAAFDDGAVVQQLPLDEIAEEALFGPQQ